LTASPRLSAQIWVGALLRRVHAAGDFATVLQRGDAISGSVVLVHRTRDGRSSALARRLGDDGGYVWSIAAADAQVDPWLEKQRAFDPDLWVVELDTPYLARFVDETIAPG